MQIVKRETTILPNTPQGRKMADAIVASMQKYDGVFKGRKEDTQHITVYGEYIFHVRDEEDE